MLGIEEMCGWKGVWMGGCVDGRMWDGRVRGWEGVWMGGCVDGRVCGWEGVWMGGWGYFVEGIRLAIEWGQGMGSGGWGQGMGSGGWGQEGGVRDEWGLG